MEVKRMTKSEAIAELVRIWHSPHLDLSLKAGLAEAIDTLKESNLNDSLVRDSSDACKESESKLDLISRQDAIEVLTETIAPPSVTLDTLVMRIDALPSAEAAQGEWIHDGQNFKCGLDWCHCSECGYKTSTNGLRVYRYCPNCGAKMGGGAE